MPLITAIEQITDGFRVTRTNGAVIELTTADIPNNVKRNLVTPADYENWINNTWLPKIISYTNPDGETEWLFYMKVHVESLNPMVAIARCSDFPIPDGWWQ